MWLEALSTNKMPSTVAQLFLDRILEYGGRYKSIFFPHREAACAVHVTGSKHPPHHCVQACLHGKVPTGHGRLIMPTHRVKPGSAKSTGVATKTTPAML